MNEQEIKKVINEEIEKSNIKKRNRKFKITLSENILVIMFCIFAILMISFVNTIMIGSQLEEILTILKTLNN